MAPRSWVANVKWVIAATRTEKHAKEEIHFPLKENPLQHQNNKVKLGVRTGKCRYGCAHGNVMQCFRTREIFNID
jgi:hypothetical protein